MCACFIILTCVDVFLHHMHDAPEYTLVASGQCGQGIKKDYKRTCCEFLRSYSVDWYIAPKTDQSETSTFILRASIFRAKTFLKSQRCIAM